MGPHRGCREILGCGIKEQRGARFVFMQHGRGSGVGCVGGCRCCSRTVGHRSPNDSGFRKESFPAQLASLVAQHLPVVQETRVPSLGQEGPLEKTMATHSSTLAGESHGQRSVVGYSPRVLEELDTQLSDFTFSSHLEAWTETGALPHVVVGVSLCSGRSGPDT